MRYFSWDKLYNKKRCRRRVPTWHAAIRPVNVSGVDRELGHSVSRERDALCVIFVRVTVPLTFWSTSGTPIIPAVLPWERFMQIFFYFTLFVFK